MNKFLSAALAIVLILGLGSCQKEETETPGNITGMGDTPGDFKVVAPFTLPQGISIVGDITGLENPGAKGDDSKAVAYSCYGSGGKMIKLRLTLVNRNNYPRTVFFPKGLLWKSATAGYQDAACLQTTWISLQANSQRTITLDLYCINYGLLPSDNLSSYRFVGVTSSPVFNNLLKMIGWKMINYEWLYPNPSKSDLADGPSYDEIVDRMQTIVWNLTNNGIEVTEADKAFIQSIPELPTESIPVVDEKSQFPEYFEELIVEEL